MDWVSICLGIGIILQIFVNFRLISTLTVYIEELLREIVEDLPPALGAAMSENIKNGEMMQEINPIQMAIAQMIPKLLDQPKIEVKEIQRSQSGKFQ